MESELENTEQLSQEQEERLKRQSAILLADEMHQRRKKEYKHERKVRHIRIVIILTLLFISIVISFFVFWNLKYRNDIKSDTPIEVVSK